MVRVQGSGISQGLAVAAEGNLPSWKPTWNPKRLPRKAGFGVQSLSKGLAKMRVGLEPNYIILI